MYANSPSFSYSDIFVPQTVTQYIADPYYKPKYSYPIVTSSASPFAFTTIDTDSLDIIPIQVDPNAAFFNKIANPRIASVNLGYTQPLFGTYENLNTQKSIQNKIIKYFRYKMLDKWLYGSLLDVLNYFRVNQNGQVDILNNMNEYNISSVQKDSDQNINKKIKFIEEYFVTSKFVRHALENYIFENKIEWIKLPNYEPSVKKHLAKELVRVIKRNIENKRR